MKDRVNIVGVCEDCIHFKPITRAWAQKQCPGVGDCDCGKIVDLSDAKGPDQDGLGYSDFEGYQASFVVGPLFGCIHFKQRIEE